ncbi:MAG: HD domain-containing protein [Deltaproteobacteria bacterium]|nr:HD domain-containing protein [Deltaproteobacteria bacterium]
MSKAERLQGIRMHLDLEEEKRLSPWACFSHHAVRRKEDENVRLGHRQNFSLDTDRVLHSLAYTRYIDKTQVFYLIKNDHITHRVLHVQLVSKIARTIGRLLRLNEDLIEAMALGHDIGHTPFGHDGEGFLSGLCRKYGLGHFFHNVQGVRSLEHIEKKGKGWNLTLQVLDGILCHDGEVHNQALRPDRGKDFQRFDEQIREKEQYPQTDLRPMTLEGCVVRMADTISYVGRDIEDAIRLGVISRSDMPRECREVLGDTNGTIVYTLVEDLVANSLDKPFVCFSGEVGDALKRLKHFNHTRIYTSERVKRETPKIQKMFELLFETFLSDLEKGDRQSVIYREFLAGMEPDYTARSRPAEVVRDFIAGMTDEYFLNQCHKRLIPERRYGSL